MRCIGCGVIVAAGILPLLCSFLYLTKWFKSGKENFLVLFKESTFVRHFIFIDLRFFTLLYGKQSRQQAYWNWQKLKRNWNSGRWIIQYIISFYKEADWQCNWKEWKRKRKKTNANECIAHTDCTRQIFHSNGKTVMIFCVDCWLTKRCN